MAGRDEAAACLNCGAPLTGPYCAGCGQKRPHTDLTLREFLHEATQELANWDGKVPHTLRALFLQPGVLTADFLAGRRARWLAPLRLYLICSVAFFLSGPLVEAITHRAARELAEITVTNPDGTTTLTPQGRQQLEAALPARLFGRDWLERAVSNNARFSGIVATAYPKAMFLLLPLFALLTSLAWRRKQPRYPAHLYLALHLHAAWFGLLAVSTVATAFFSSETVGLVVALGMFAYIAWYGVVAARRVFGDSWRTTVVKAAAIAVVYSACLFAASLGLLAYAIATI